MASDLGLGDFCDLILLLWCCLLYGLCVDVYLRLIFQLLPVGLFVCWILLVDLFVFAFGLLVLDLFVCLDGVSLWLVFVLHWFCLLGCLYCCDVVVDFDLLRLGGWWLLV